MGHIGKEFAFGNAGFLRLVPHPFNLVDIILDVGHIQNQNNTALSLAVYIYDISAMAFVLPSVNRKTLRIIFVQYFFTEIFHYPDVLPQLVGRQTGKNICRCPVIADQTVMVIQRNHAIAQAFQNFFRCQMAEIIITPAPDYNNHQRHRYSQRHRGKIEYFHKFADIGYQHNNRQGGDSQNRPILTADFLIRTLADCAHQCVDT